MAAFPLWVLIALAVRGPVETRFVQVGPVARPGAQAHRSEDRDRAVLLIHGLKIHPFSNDQVAVPLWHSWQRPGSTLVRALEPDADVYAFAYGQNAPVEAVARSPLLRDAVARLRALGYRQIVLVGHSAGGIVARHFVEDNPGAGVTKIIQVCSPNGGSSLGSATIGVRQDQEPFLKSLSKKGRRQTLAARAGKRVPPEVEFVCVVGQLHVDGSVSWARDEDDGDKEVIRVGLVAGVRGDGLISTASQWPADLQEQGVPAVPLNVAHFSALRTRTGAEAVARLVKERHPRWDPEQVQAARHKILGTSPR